MKKFLIKTLSLLLIGTSINSIPVFAAENSKPVDDIIIAESVTPLKAMMRFHKTATKTYSDFHDIKDSIYIDTYEGGVHASGYIKVSSAVERSGSWVVTYAGYIVGNS